MCRTTDMDSISDLAAKHLKSGNDNVGSGWVFENTRNISFVFAKVKGRLLERT